MRIVQPSVAKRITFATWARKAGHRRHSAVSYFVPEDVDIPASLLVGAQIDGKPYEEKPKAKPRRTRSKPVDEPVETVDNTPEPEQEQDPVEKFSFSPDDGTTKED